MAEVIRQKRGTAKAPTMRSIGGWRPRASEQIFYRWKKVCGRLGVAELRRMKQLEDENQKLKQLVASLSLDKHILRDVLPKN